MNPETKMGRRITAELDYQLKDIPHHIFRVESNMTVNGIPDIYVCANGRSFWIELKIDSPILPFQKSWHKQHALAGGKSFVLFYDYKEYKVSTGDKLHLPHCIFDNQFVAIRHILRIIEEDALIGPSKSS